MAIRNWGEDDELTESEDEKRRKKEVGPAFWVAVLVVLAASPWLIKAPGWIKAWQNAKAVAVPEVCNERAFALLEREREAPELPPPPAEFPAIEEVDLTRPAKSTPASLEPKSENLELVAFALAVPLGDDPVAPGRDAVEMLEFFHPRSLAPIPHNRLLKLGAENENLAICKARVWHPVLRLVFQKNSARKLDAEIEDRVTDRQTGFRVEGEIAPVVHEIGQLLILDSAIGIWHDAPLIVEIRNAAGSESFEISGLPTAPNGKDVENLFDVRIPRARVWSRTGTTTSQLDLVRAAAELHGGERIWPYRPNEAESGDRVEADFYDVSPRELTLQLGKRRALHFDPDTLSIRSN